MEGHEVDMTAAERKRRRAEDEASYALLKTILNAIFVTTGLVLLLAVIVVIVYTTFGTVQSYTLIYAANRSTQPCTPPGSLNRVPASAGVRAGMSALPGGR